jgi:hypothetical protein
MEISYQLVADDYRHGMRAWQLNSAWRRWSFRFGLVLMPMLLVGSAILLFSVPELRLVSGFSLGIAVLWLLAVYLSPWLQGRMQFRRMPSAHSPMTMTFSDSGLQVRSEHYDSHVNWSTYIGWAEEKSVFVLFPQPRIYVPIPKRAFTVEQQNEFRELLRRNIKPLHK